MFSSLMTRAWMPTSAPSRATYLVMSTASEVDLPSMALPLPPNYGCPNSPPAVGEHLAACTTLSHHTTPAPSSLSRPATHVSAMHWLKSILRNWKAVGLSIRVMSSMPMRLILLISIEPFFAWMTFESAFSRRQVGLYSSFRRSGARLWPSDRYWER